jgi:NAD(P)-dependent dehydrogenase (short-subunit alcohol dehydrogenase family)
MNEKKHKKEDPTDTPAMRPQGAIRECLTVRREHTPAVISIRAPKFGLEGWMESLEAEVEPFGIQTMVVNPGFFRTELLTKESTNYAEPSIADYDERRAQQQAAWNSYNGKQSGDPAKLARALITLASQKELPRRFIAGADAIGTAEQKVAVLQQQINAYRELSTSLTFDEVRGAGNGN